MTIEKTQRINNLLDLYKDLLTDKQQEVMDMYFLYDLSLSEIAEDTNTTRAAVFDLIKRTTKTLENYESKLHLLEKREKILDIIKDLDENIKNQIEDIL
ncbi:MAG: putative DNA-binding protein [Bacilli bacterium]|nr:putative DNA-binding protein [Bacilli bacterium]